MERLKAYQKLIDSSLDIIFSTGDEGKFINVSAVSRQVLGYLPEELVGKSFFDFIVESDLASTISIMQIIMQGNDVNNFENNFKCKDGSIVSLAWSARWDEETGIIYGVARDVTEHKKEQEAFRQQGDRLKGACKLAKLGIWEMDVVNNSFYSSDELFELYGLDINERSFISIEEFFSLVHPDDAQSMQEALLQPQDLTTHTFKHRLIKANTGEVVYLLQDLQAIIDSNHNVIGIHGTVKDITDIEKMFIALEESEKELRVNARRLTEILETLGDGFVTFDRNYTITYWNRKAEELLGICKEAALGNVFMDLFPEAVETKFSSEFKRALQENVSVHFEEYLDSVKMSFEVSVYPCKDGLSVYLKNITDQKIKEQELKISNERFESVSKATRDAIWDCNIVNKTTYYNEAFTYIFGHPHFEQQSADIWEKNVHPDDLERVVREVNNALNNPVVSIMNTKYRFARLNGSFAYVHDRAIIIRDSNGKAIRMVGSMQDITRQKEAEFLLEKSEKRFRAMVQSGQDLIALVNSSFQIIYVSSNYQQISGNSVDQIIGVNIFDLVHSDDLEAVKRASSKIHEQRIINLPHYRFQASDGTYKWFETTLTNFLDDEDIHAIICNTRDITKRKAALEEVMKLSTIVQETSNSVILTDPNGYIQWVNRAFTKRTGYTLEEVEGKYPMDLLHGVDTCEETVKYITDCTRKKLSFHCELVHYTKSGQNHWVSINGKAIFDETGAVKHWFFIQTDITTRKEAEEALKMSEERYKLLFYKSPNPKWIFNAQTYQIVEVNDASSDLFGYSREEFLGMTIPELRIDANKQMFDLLIQETLRKDEKTYYKVFWLKKKNGEAFQVEINAHAIDLVSGLHFIVTAYDLSERLDLQNKIFEEKVAAQKEVTKAIINTQEKERSNISKELHDNVNQILTAAKLCVENTKYYPDQRDLFTDKCIMLIQNAIQEIRSLSKTLMSPAVYEAGLKVTILEMLDQYKNLKRFDIIESLEFDEGVIDKELKLTIYRIIQEQMNNMVKYAQATCVKVVIMQQGNRLVVLVQDDGIGFDTGCKKNGLGLANIKSRVELFQGTLEIKSAPGQGCRTIAVFPI
jgi:PAS domain S-box-containing protein